MAGHTGGLFSFENGPVLYMAMISRISDFDERVYMWKN